MKRTITITPLLVLILCFFNSYSQKKYNFISDSIINVTPFWKKGMTKKFSYSKKKYIVKYGNRISKQKLDSLSYLAVFKVIDSNNNSYKIEWFPYEYKHTPNININAEQLNNFTQKGIPLIYTTDNYGVITKYNNVNQVKNYWTNTLKEFFDTVENSIPNKVKEVFLSNQMLESYFLPPIELIHQIIGYKYNVGGEKYKNIDIIDLAVTKDTLNTIEEYYFTDINKQSLSFKYHQKTTYDNKGALIFFENLSKGMLPKNNINLYFKDKYVDVNITTVIYFNLKDCLPKNIILKKDIKLFDKNNALLLNYIEEHTMETIN
jgi:hypothetical protein